MKHYRSSIPKVARERVTATFEASQQKRIAEYILNGKLVGVRHFHETGELKYENPLRNGLLHGIVYRSDIPGKLLSAEPYFKGFPHGTASQWSDEGKLIGTYTMKQGTGIDLVVRVFRKRTPLSVRSPLFQRGETARVRVVAE